MCSRIFYPRSSKDFTNQLLEGQRYRHQFGDKRLYHRYRQLLSQMIANQQAAISRLSTSWKEQIAYYRFLRNSNVEIPELIYESCRLQVSVVSGSDLLVPIDGSSIGMRLHKKHSDEWQRKLGVIDDNRTPGFYVYPSLVVDRSTGILHGLGDISVYTRPLVVGTAAEKRALRKARNPLTFDEKEGSIWSLVISNTSKRLQAARSVTYLMDQGADKYESLERIISETGHDFIVRSKENREAESVSSAGKTGRLSEILSSETWSETHIVRIRGLHHYSKSSGALVQRKEREAKLRIRYSKVILSRPAGYSSKLPVISKPLSVIEVVEDASTVPSGESPIHWRLLTTWSIDSVEKAWEVVSAYQFRWTIEQLFRVLKKEGFDVESSQLEDPDSLIKQVIMSLKASSEAMQLTLARDGKTFIPIETMFDDHQQQALKRLNARLSSETQKVKNSHAENSLAWAAWVIARLGNWSGYQSQRPPGPITMKRGLDKFYDILWAWELKDDS